MKLQLNEKIIAKIGKDNFADVRGGWTTETNIGTFCILTESATDCWGWHTACFNGTCIFDSCEHGNCNPTWEETCVADWDENCNESVSCK